MQVTVILEAQGLLTRALLPYSSATVMRVTD